MRMAPYNRQLARREAQREIRLSLTRPRGDDRRQEGRQTAAQQRT